MADDVLAVEWDAVALGQVADQLGRRFVHGVGEPLLALNGDGFMLDANRVHVEVPVAGMPGDVPGRHELGNPTAGRADHVVSRRAGGGILEVRHHAIPATLGGVNDDVANRQAVLGPVGDVVVAVAAGHWIADLVGRWNVLAAQIGRTVWVNLRRWIGRQTGRWIVRNVGQLSGTAASQRHCQQLQKDQRPGQRQGQLGRLSERCRH